MYNRIRLVSFLTFSFFSRVYPYTHSFVPVYSVEISARQDRGKNFSLPRVHRLSRLPRLGFDHHDRVFSAHERASLHFLLPRFPSPFPAPSLCSTPTPLTTLGTLHETKDCPRFPGLVGRPLLFAVTSATHGNSDSFPFPYVSRRLYP